MAEIDIVDASRMWPPVARKSEERELTWSHQLSQHSGEGAVELALVAPALGWTWAGRGLDWAA